MADPPSLVPSSIRVLRIIAQILQVSSRRQVSAGYNTVTSASTVPIGLLDVLCAQRNNGESLAKREQQFNEGRKLWI